MSEKIFVSLEEVAAAHKRIASSVLRSPTLLLNADPPSAKVYLKLENLQPTGSFKLRGAANALASATENQLLKGVYTISSGNMAQGVAWLARKGGINCSVVVPDDAPDVKLNRLIELGAKIVKISYGEWWTCLMNHVYEPLSHLLYIDAVSGPAVMAGEATCALEIYDAVPEVDTVIVPFGCGGLCLGVASVLKALKPAVKVYACEVETGAPLAESLARGRLTDVPHAPSFVDGIGAKNVPEEIWPQACALLDGSIVVTLEEIAKAVALLAERNHVIAEGAGAAPVAAALKGLAGSGTVVCIITGGNIDTPALVSILRGKVPRI